MLQMNNMSPRNQLPTFIKENTSFYFCRNSILQKSHLAYVQNAFEVLEPLDFLS